MFVDTIVSGYTFFSDKNKSRVHLEAQSTQWVELRDTTITDNYITGYMDDSFAILGYPDKTHMDNDALKTIVDIFQLILNTSALRLALNDYRMARRSRLEDTFVYLFRAIESIRKHFDVEGDSAQANWDRMHNALGTSESQISPLTQEAKKARHGDFKNLDIDQNRLDTCMKITEDVIDAFLCYISNGKNGKSLKVR